jgi:cbb3-type cytochrome oxidase maturation protein
VSVVLVVLPLALLLVAAAVAAWVWAARSGQFDDTETPATRVLVDDAEPAPLTPPARPPGPGSGPAAPSSPASARPRCG